MSEEGGRASFSRYREWMAAHGFRPSRSRGQNFLLDPTLHRRIAEAAGAGPEDVVLEVGAGLGFLTRELAARAGRVVAAEIDDRLFAILCRELPGFPEGGRRVRPWRGDVLGTGGLSPELGDVLDEELAASRGRFLLVGNLPYAIAGPLLAAVTALPRPPATAVLLVQLDLARRLLAAPGERAYGGLSVLVQAAYEARILRRVPRQAFRPRPRVESAVVSLRSRGRAGLLGLDPASRRSFATLLRRLFSARRKKLRSALAAALGDAGLAARPGLAEGLLEQRPGALSWEQLLEIWRPLRGLI